NTLAILYLHQCDRARDWHPEEVEFADRVARQLAISLANARSLDALARDAQSAREYARRAGEEGNRAQLILKVLPEAVIALDAKGRLSFFNDTARDRYRLNPPDLGRPVNTIENLAMTGGPGWDQVASSDNVARFQGRVGRITVDPNSGKATGIPV